jgi:hypothetical protein
MPGERHIAEPRYQDHAHRADAIERAFEQDTGS